MPTEQEFRDCADRIRNWGRWGADDQLGTLNFITAAKVASAARLARTGRVIPLGSDLDANGIWAPSSFRRNPIHLMVVDGGDAAAFADYADQLGAAGAAITRALWGHRLFRFNDDLLITPLQAGSHWDALAHVYYDDLMYNGVPATAVTSAGASRNGIAVIDVKGVVSRGVLLDVAGFRGVPHLPSNELVLPAELTAVAAAQGVALEPGDIVALRTGWIERLRERPDLAQWRSGSPGLDWTCAQWLHDHQVAAVAADNTAVEASRYDFADDDVACPLHLLCLRDMGMIFGELWDLRELAADCRADGRYDFQLIAAPLRVPGAVGSPVNPIALK